MRLPEARRALELLADELPEAPGDVGLRPAPPAIAELTGLALTIDNPSARGALTARMMARLAAAVEQAAEDPHPVLWIQGTDGAFCSGGHLGQVRAGLARGDRGERMAEAMAVVLDALADLPRLVVGLVDGPALGGGAEVVTAMDRVLCGPGARIGFVHGRLGVAPGWGGAARLVRRIGRPRALDLLTSARILDGDEAVRVGLADEASPDGGALVEALRQSVDGVAAQSLRAVKRQVVAASPIHRTPEEQAAFAGVWGSVEHLGRLGPGRR